MSKTFMLSALIFGSILLEVQAFNANLSCYNCWSSCKRRCKSKHADDYPRCEKEQWVRKCVGVYAADLCFSFTFHDSKFQIKGCLTKEFKQFVKFCNSQGNEKNHHCNICQGHLCNKDEFKIQGKKCFVWIITTVLLLYNLIM